MSAADSDPIAVTPQVTIRPAELAFQFTRSPGPGGQNVNKVNTRVTLRFDLDASPSLTPEQKNLVRRRLRSRVGADGVLRVTVSRHRTQTANRRSAVRRFIELLAEALHEAKPRTPTRPTVGAQHRRLRSKQHRSQLKRGRGHPHLDD